MGKKETKTDMDEYWKKNNEEVLLIKIYNIIMDEVCMFDEEKLALAAAKRIKELVLTGWD